VAISPYVRTVLYGPLSCRVEKRDHCASFMGDYVRSLLRLASPGIKLTYLPGSTMSWDDTGAVLGGSTRGNRGDPFSSGALGRITAMLFFRVIRPPLKTALKVGQTTAIERY